MKGNAGRVLHRVVNFIISNAPGTTYLSDNDGNSVLHVAAERGHEVLVECLMNTHNFGLIVGARYVLDLYKRMSCFEHYLSLFNLLAIHLMG